MTEGQIQSPDYEPLARAQGWVPKEEFRGDHGAVWKDAESYYKQAMEVLPILRKTNQGLHSDLAQTKSALTNLTAELRAANAAIKTIQASQEEDLAERTEAIRTQILQQIKAAKKEDDIDREVDLQEDLRKLDLEAAKRPAVQKEERSGEEHPVLPPEAIAAYSVWVSANPWFDTDRKRAAVAMGLANALKAEQPGLIGPAFYAALDRELASVYPVQRARGDSKVEGGGSDGEGGGGREGGGKAYADLPAEAKAAAAKQAKHFVGKDRKYKTAAEWNAAYARTYFSS